jgi:hypothetical protein
MKKIMTIVIIIVLVPVYLVLFVVIHELGHTISARLLGDPNSTFYLVQMGAESSCFGCNIYDPMKLSWSANIVVSIGGLIATQLISVIMTGVRFASKKNRILNLSLGTIALGYAFLDVVVQVFQGLLYNLHTHTFPTEVDLTDFMLLIRQKIEVNQAVLKGIIVALSAVYLLLIIWLNSRARYIKEQSREKNNNDIKNPSAQPAIADDPCQKHAGAGPRSVTEQVPEMLGNLFTPAGINSCPPLRNRNCSNTRFDPFRSPRSRNHCIGRSPMLIAPRFVSMSLPKCGSDMLRKGERRAGAGAEPRFGNTSLQKPKVMYSAGRAFGQGQGAWRLR